MTRIAATRRQAPAELRQEGTSVQSACHVTGQAAEAKAGAAGRLKARATPVTPRIRGRSSVASRNRAHSRKAQPSRWAAKRYSTVHRSTVCIRRPPARASKAAPYLWRPLVILLCTGPECTSWRSYPASGRPALMVQDWSWLGLPATPNYTLAFLSWENPPVLHSRPVHLPSASPLIFFSPNPSSPIANHDQASSPHLPERDFTSFFPSPASFPSLLTAEAPRGFHRPTTPLAYRPRSRTRALASRESRVYSLNIPRPTLLPANRTHRGAIFSSCSVERRLWYVPPLFRRLVLKTGTSQPILSPPIRHLRICSCHHPSFPKVGVFARAVSAANVAAPPTPPRNDSPPTTQDIRLILTWRDRLKAVHSVPLENKRYSDSVHSHHIPTCHTTSRRTGSGLPRTPGTTKFRPSGAVCPYFERSLWRKPGSNSCSAGTNGPSSQDEFAFFYQFDGMRPARDPPGSHDRVTRCCR